MSDNTAFDLHYGSNNTDESRVIEWLNSAVLSTNPSEKANLLHKVQEFVLNRSPHLLMRVLPNILEYTSDRVTEVKKWLVGFIEEACKKNELVFEKVLTNLHMLLCDESIQVQKRVIQAATSVYRNMLNWLAKAPQVTDGMEQAWNRFSSIKLEILNMVDSDNDGIRTHSIKFLEGVVLLQSYTDSNLPRKENDFSLDDIPLTLKFARRRKLEEEANHIFFLLVKFHGSPHISSVNLMACMGALCTIAKARPQFMQHTVTALENLNSNLPPSLTQSQVNSVKKHMKLQLINILKHPSSYDVQSQVTSILSDLGMASHEIARIMPKNDDRRSRSSKRNTEQIAPPPVVSKRPRIEPPVEIPFESSIDMEVDEDEVDKQKQESNKLNVQFILEKLNPQSATQIVMESMNKLPETAPAYFLENYRPFSNSGSLAHLALIAKLLAEQFTDTRVGPGKSAVSKEPPMKLKVHPSIEEAIVKGPSSKKEPEIPAPPILEEPFDPAKIKIKEEKEDKIPKVVKPKIKTLKYEFREQLLVKSVQRVLHAEHAANQGGASMIRNKIITTLATTFGSLVRDTILFFILQDLKTHIDLALSWLYQEYSYMQGFNRINSLIRKEQKPDQDYNSVLCALVSSIELIPCDQDILLVKIFQEAPMITEEALEIFKRLSVQENRAGTCMSLLKDLVIRRPPKHMIFMNILLQRSIHEVSIVREEAIIKVLQLYEYEHLKDVIEEHAVMYLGFLTQTQPPPILFGEEHGRLQILDNWSDESAKACLYLYLALLPAKPSLIQELSRIYIQTTADVKRTIIRLLEVPIRTMGMDSSELLTLVEQCPKGAETLVTRVIHILTEKETPSVTLVAKVRELYQTRVPDVRFLIPVLIGLTKKEIIAALPKLIKLNPVVVKEVFNRLLNTESPITPADLLIALHTIDASKADLKTVMKATSLCFSEKSVFTQEVLAVVMQQLMDVTPLPTLLMRTVIQSLSLYPRLSGFIMNILQRLILKQVWKQKVVWEGFIKCCQRTKPQSFQVLLQLPTVQLAEVFETCPELRLPLLEHVQAFNETQRAHIPVSIMDVLMGRSDTLIKMEDENIKPEITDINNVINEPLPPGMD